MQNIKEPTLLLNKELCLSHIASMFMKAKKSDCELHPHFKSHQSAEIGSWYKDFGIKSITVSSVRMAEYFYKSGWENITIAFPVNVREVERLNNLTKKCHINILISSAGVIPLLSKYIKSKTGFYLEFDNGYNRSGFNYNEMEQIEEVIAEAKNSFLEFIGFYCHPGNTYLAKSKEEILNIHRKTTEQLNSLKIIFSAIFPDIKISLGDTPSCSIADSFDDLDIISPGNFIFYDMQQYMLGGCISDDIALAMACPVVAINSARNELVIHGGAVHFSKDFYINNQGIRSYGAVVFLTEKGWMPLLAGAELISISQEHGVVKMKENEILKIHTGDMIGILPAHACLTADCMGYYMTTEGEIIEMMSNNSH